jgi:hypothetical protein
METRAHSSRWRRTTISHFIIQHSLPRDEVVAHLLKCSEEKFRWQAREAINVFAVVKLTK